MLSTFYWAPPTNNRQNAVGGAHPTKVRPARHARAAFLGLGLIFVWLVGIRDWVLSSLLIASAGTEAELNPFAHGLMRFWSADVLLSLKLAALLLLTLATLIALRKHERLAVRTVCFAVLVSGLVEIWWDAVLLGGAAGGIPIIPVMVEEEFGPGSRHRLIRRMDKDVDGFFESVSIKIDEDGDGCFEATQTQRIAPDGRIVAQPRQRAAVH